MMRGRPLTRNELIKNDYFWTYTNIPLPYSIITPVYLHKLNWISFKSTCVSYIDFSFNTYFEHDLWLTTDYEWKIVFSGPKIFFSSITELTRRRFVPPRSQEAGNSRSYTEREKCGSKTLTIKLAISSNWHLLSLCFNVAYFNTGLTWPSCKITALLERKMILLVLSTNHLG